MASNLNGGFKVTARETIDTRIVLTLEQMKAEQYTPGETSSLIAIPNHYFCLCADDDSLYIFNANNAVDEITGRFRKLETGSSIDHYIKAASVEGTTLTLIDEEDNEIVFDYNDLVLKTLSSGNSTAELKGEGNIEFKTINGAPIIGEGNIETATKTSYVDLSDEASVSLDELKGAGIYKIAHASDAPENTAASGFLKVNELDNDKVEQDWCSDTNHAHRVLGEVGPVPPTPEEGFYVNDVKTVADENGDVHLDSAGTYTLSGNLEGRVVIDSSDLVKDFTTIILNGVTITTAKDSAIYSAGGEGRLIVEISANTVNILTSNLVGELSSTGLIHSESDLTVNGNGTLRLISKAGHGMKGGDILISGKPDIYIDAEHDGIHGKLVRIAGGTYYVKHANDAFSAGSGKHTGNLMVSGGEITIEKCNENVFQAKVSEEDPDVTESAIKIYFDTKLTLMEGFSSEPVCEADNIEIYPTVTINKPAGTSIPWIVNIATKYGTPVIEDAERDVWTPDDDGVFTLTKGGKMVYTLTGNFTGYRIKTTQPQAQLSLFGVWLDDNSDDENPFIEYVSTLPETDQKNVKIILNEGRVSYLHKKNGGILKSVNNVEINNGNLDLGFGGTDLCMVCDNGYCMDIGNSARILNDGTRYFINSKTGVKAANIDLGDEVAEEDYTKSKTTLIYFDNNEEYDVGVFSRSYKSKYYPGSVNVAANCFGTASLGKVVELDDTADGTIVAEEHIVTPKDTQSFTRHAFVYALPNDLTNTRIIILTPENENIILNTSSNENAEVGTWKVYAGITTAELDANYVRKTDYIALQNRVTTLEAYKPKVLGVTCATDANDIKIYTGDLDTTGKLLSEYTANSIPVFVRDGDTGEVALHNCGQFNFGPVDAFSDTRYFDVTVTPATAYNKFKTPYTTFTENVYRVTKINQDASIVVTEKDEADLAGWNVTYKLVLPEDYEGILPTITRYRTKDCAINDFAGKVLDFTEGDVSEFTYSKETGLRAKLEVDEKNKPVAQANFKVVIDGELPEGYQLTVSGSGTYNKLEEYQPGMYQATQVASDCEFIFKISAPFSVTYNGDAGYTDDPAGVGYKFEVKPTFVAEGDKLDFTINYENIDTTQYRKPTSGDAEDGFNLLDTVMCDETDLKEFVTYQTGETGPGGKKAKFSIPGEHITGDIVINAQSIEIIPASVTYETVGFDTVSPAWQIEDGAIPSTAGIGSPFQFEVRHNAGNASFWTTDEGLAAITSITSNGVDVKDKLQCTEVSKQKFKYVLAADGVTGDIAMTITAQTK